MSEIKICPYCRRRKKVAIEQQVALRKVCEVDNATDCVFRREIQDAIDKKTNLKFVKRTKPKIKVVEKPKPNIVFIKKK